MSGAAARARVAPLPADVDRVNVELEGAPAEEIIRWGVGAFAPGRLALVSAFGPGSAVLIHMLADIAPDLPVVFVDTLHHFPETLEHMERVRARYDLNLRIYRPAASREEFEARYGPRLWERDLARYQELAKVEPFREATRGLDAWFTGRRRDQSESRIQLPTVEPGEKIRVNPLISWTRRDIWRYIYDHDLQYNPLHDRGYASIGDAQLTTPVESREEERAGRWRGSDVTECGIHLV